jgi:hypothetical protein
VQHTPVSGDLLIQALDAAIFAIYVFQLVKSSIHRRLYLAIFILTPDASQGHGWISLRVSP